MRVDETFSPVLRYEAKEEEGVKRQRARRKVAGAK